MSAAVTYGNGVRENLDFSPNLNALVALPQLSLLKHLSRLLANAVKLKKQWLCV